MKFTTPAGTNPIDAKKVVGQPHPRIDGPLKVSGKATYAYEWYDALPETPAYGVVVGAGQDFTFRPARVVAVDRGRDLAHLRLTSGAPLPALALGDSRAVLEGQALAFTGFPLGMVLGLNHVTHRAMLSAVTPIVMPSMSSRGLDARAITQLQRDPLKIFQLDGTAYPGNSGSPVYDPETGAVLAVINMVFVKGLKENAISSPSGISYAIPVQYVHELLQRK